jgi:plasmid stabilization system protein ParE
MVGKINDRCRRLLRFPYSRQRLDPERFGELRRLVIEPYIVVYRVRRSTVEILRILHGARDLTAMLNREATHDSE